MTQSTGMNNNKSSSHSGKNVSTGMPRGNDPLSANVVRICGSSRTECGYCKGSRASLAPTEDNGQNGNLASGAVSLASTSSKAYSLLADSMTPEVYEEFLYRGWRRSGTYLYKPDNWHSCCPAITIRQRVNQYSPSKSQRRVKKQMEKLLNPFSSTKSTTTGHKRNRSKSLMEDSMSETHRQSRAMSERALFEGGVIEQLQNIVSSGLPPFVKEQSLLAIKPTFKLQMEDRNQFLKRDRQRISDGTLVTVYTPICAAIAGRSNGTLCRDALSTQLVQQLQKSYGGQAFTTHGAFKAVWSIKSIHNHAKSGQIFFALELQPHASTDNGFPHTGSSMEVDETSTTSSSSIASDKFKTWWQQNYVAPDAHAKVPTTATEAFASSSALRHQSVPSPPYRLAIETLPAHVSALNPEVHKLYFLYQHEVHQDQDPFQAMQSDHRHVISSDGTANEGENQDPSSSQQEQEQAEEEFWGGKHPPGWVVQAKAMLQKEYQELPSIVQEKVTKNFCSFCQFLVESPFPLQDNKKAKKPRSLQPGTYHQHYRIGGLLIAVGVVDVLPQGLSSVYLFYHPQFAHQLVPLGKYAILKEIECAQQGGMPYYYLGYYIESCTKMRYKADYKPSELLCPTSYRWVDAPTAQMLLRKNSPVHHCCTLYYENVKDVRGKKNNGKSNSERTAYHDKNKGSIMRSQEQGSQNTSADSQSRKAKGTSVARKAAEQVQMDVGVGYPVILSWLQRAQETVGPLLEEFVTETGPDLSKKCLVRFS